MESTLASGNSSLESRKILLEAVEAARDAKGQNLTVFNVRGLYELADYLLIVTARSDRQSLGISHRIIDRLQQLGVKPESIEGTERGHWVLIDLGDVIVHVFYEPIREYYDIEGLWAHAKRSDLDETADPNTLVA